MTIPPPGRGFPRLFAALLLLTACTAPRSVLHSPEATPRGGWRAGGSLDVNLPTQTSKALYGGLEKGVDLLVSRAGGSDTAVPIAAKDLNAFTRALMAQSLDPLGTQTTLYLRYGIWDRLDAGYRFAGGAHAFDARLQFLGPGEGGDAGAWRGSLAVQYSGQDYDLLSVLGRLQDLLRFEFKRKDILVPVIFGKPLGAGGRFGSFGIGAVYNLSLIEYDTGILKLVEQVDSGTVIPFQDLRGDRAIHAFGGFANGRLGFRFVHFLASMTLYRQDYGTFRLFGGENASLAGWTLVPSLGIEFRF